MRSQQRHGVPAHRRRAARRIVRAACAVALLGAPLAAHAQTLDPRRLAMGGVITSDRAGSNANVAYGAVPHGEAGRHWIPIPLGLVQFAANHPSFDPHDSTFNAFDIANLLL